MAVKPLVEDIIYPLLSSPQSNGKEDFSAAWSNFQLINALGFPALKDTAGNILYSAINSIVDLAIPWDVALTDFRDSCNYSFPVIFFS